MDALLGSLNGLAEPRSELRSDLQAAIRDLAASASALRGFAQTIESQPKHALDGKDQPVTSVLRPVLSDLAAMLVLGSAACGMSGPPPVEYVLGAAPNATQATSQVTAVPVLEVRLVRLPDYLDTTDLLVRDGNRLTPSKGGRWGERLSVGMTRALASALAARLPNMVATTSQPVKSPERGLLVDVSALEARSDRQSFSPPAGRFTG